MGINTNNNLTLIVQRWRKRSARMPAIFLDRDGTIVALRDKMIKPAQIRLLRGAPEALRSCAQRGYLLIVLTNQPIIGRGLITVSEAKKINEQLRRKFAEKGVRLDAAYTCPHQFSAGCVCRKPKLALIGAARKDFFIDMKKSWLIGDTTRDMECGRRAKLKTILVKTGDGGKDKRFFKTRGNYAVKDLHAAALVVS